jgi:hypothetical protein
MKMLPQCETTVAATCRSVLHTTKGHLEENFFIRKRLVELPSPNFAIIFVEEILRGLYNRTLFYRFITFV